MSLAVAFVTYSNRFDSKAKSAIGEMICDQNDVTSIFISFILKFEDRLKCLQNMQVAKNTFLIDQNIAIHSVAVEIWRSEGLNEMEISW
mgnify:CR=1 FL=1